MKVLLINGSRRDAGCTYTALSKAAEAIESEGVETEIINSPFRFPLHLSLIN